MKVVAWLPAQDDRNSWPCVRANMWCTRDTCDVHVICAVICNVYVTWILFLFPVNCDTFHSFWDMHSVIEILILEFYSLSGFTNLLDWDFAMVSCRPWERSILIGWFGFNMWCTRDVMSAVIRYCRRVYITTSEHFRNVLAKNSRPSPLRSDGNNPWEGYDIFDCIVYISIQSLGRVWHIWLYTLCKYTILGKGMNCPMFHPGSAILDKTRWDTTHFVDIRADNL